VTAATRVPGRSCPRGIPYRKKPASIGFETNTNRMAVELWFSYSIVTDAAARARMSPPTSVVYSGSGLTGLPSGDIRNGEVPQVRPSRNGLTVPRRPG
jgi:hypothetical protein